MILCTGEAVIDMIRTGEAFMPIPGGCAYNTSIAIGRLGVPVSFFGRISKNFFGEMQVKRLQENSVDTSLILRCEQNPILAFIKIEEGKDPQYAFYEEGTADRLLSLQEFPALSGDINCIVFGSVSIAMEPIGSTIETLVLNEAGKRVVAFDPNIRPVMIHNREAYLKRFKKLASASTIVKISIEDFEYLEPEPEPEKALEKLIGYGTRLAIITLGKDGCIGMLKKDDGSVIKACAPGEPVEKIIDTVGAGDTFMGAFLVWLERRGLMSHNGINDLSEAELKSALEFANKAAAFVCTQQGCNPPTINKL